MKKILALLLFSTCSMAVGETVVRADLSVGLWVSGHGWEKKVGDVKCGRTSGKKSDKSEAPAKWVSAKNGLQTVEASSELRYDVVPARRFSLKHQTAKDGETTTVSVLVEDAIRKEPWSHHRKARCKEQYMERVGDRNFLNGKIQIGFRMPKNTWAVMIRRSQYNGVFQLSKSRGTESLGALNSGDDQGLPEKDIIVWAAPGTVVYQEFHLKDESFGERAEGHFSISFTPTQQASHFASLKEVKDFLRSPTTQKEDRLPYLLGLLSDEAKLTQLSRSSKETSLLIEVLDLLEKIKLEWSTQPRVQHDKIAASILAYKFSMELLDRVAPYCRMESVTLPSTGEKTQVLALKLASYIMGRARARIENQHFSHYRSFLEGVTEFEKRGLTFADVRNNADHFQKVKTSYDLLRSSDDLDLSPMEGTARDLKTLTSRFPSIGPEDASFQNILRELDDARTHEKIFQERFFAFIKSFQKHNSNRIDSRELKTLIENLEIAQLNALDLIQKNYQALDFSGSSRNFSSTIVELISHHIALFKAEKNRKTVTTFNRVQDYFGTLPETEAIKVKMNACVGM